MTDESTPDSRVESSALLGARCPDCGGPEHHYDCWQEYDEGYDCPHCDEGTMLVCCDDMCHGQGWCMHGDGEVMCPHCNGSGVLTPNTQADSPAKKEPHHD